MFIVTLTSRNATETHEVDTDRQDTAEAWARTYAKPWETWTVAPKPSNWEAYVARLAAKNGTSVAEADRAEAGRIVRKTLPQTRADGRS